MPEIPSLMKFFQQIINLRAVSSSENKNNASLLEKKQNILDTLKSMKHHRQNIFTTTPDVSYTSDTKILLFHQGYPLAETTLKNIK